MYVQHAANLLCTSSTSRPTVMDACWLICLVIDNKSAEEFRETRLTKAQWSMENNAHTFCLYKSQHKMNCNNMKYTSVAQSNAYHIPVTLKGNHITIYAI